MPDKFDPYRESLIMEVLTEWPEEYAGELTPEQLARVEEALHSDPENCSHIEYIRTHTGFCRKIVATADEVAERLE